MLLGLTMLVLSINVLVTISFAAYAILTEKETHVYITTQYNDMEKVIQDKREMLRVIWNGLTPSFFSWLNWITVLAIVRYFSDKSDALAFDIIFWIGSILIPAHFYGQIARLQVDIKNAPQAHRVVQMIHGLWLGTIMVATQEITKYASVQIYLMQGDLKG